VKRIVIDTNVVVSFLTDRDLRQQELAARLFQDADAALALVAGSRKDSYLATFDRNFEKSLRRLGIRTYKPGD